MRICQDCGDEMHKVKVFKNGYMRKNCIRYKCNSCEFEQSFTLKEEEEQEVELLARQRERQDRSTDKY